MSTNDEQLQAEHVDGEGFGRQPGDDRPLSPGGFPPDRPLGVEDPMLLAAGVVGDDDLVIRDWRHGGGDQGRITGTRLVPVAPGDPATGLESPGDAEPTLVARDAVEVPDPAPEEAALRIVQVDADGPDGGH